MPNVELHRIDLRPELRPQTGYDRNDRRMPRGYGATPMSYRGEVFGQSNQPLYAAARWLLDQGIASPSDEVATYRGETMSMHGVVGDLAKLTVIEHDDPGKHRRPTLELRPWKPWNANAVGRRTAEVQGSDP
jgi:hypothetical protein